jgi:alcohol dehydrogenase class IV
VSGATSSIPTAFEFATATEIVFGRGRIAELGRRAREFGSRALFVTGGNPQRFPRALEALSSAGIHSVGFKVLGEPSTELVEHGVELARSEGVELVIGLGGGSALDAAKAIAALTPNPGSPLDYLEVVGRGRALERPSLVTILSPTTAGTGSEVTKNAVLTAEAHQVKVSLRGLRLLPRLALVDSELTHSVSPDVTAATGLDALTQVLEPFVSNARGPLTDALCLEGLRRGARSLRRAVADGSDAAAREDLAVTSLFGGLALANAKLGAVHGFAGPLGGRFSAPHGALCARLLPAVMQANLDVLRRTDQHDLLERYAAIARIFTGSGDARPEDGISWVEELVQDLRIPRLSQYGAKVDDFETLVAKAAAASSMKGNPVGLSQADLLKILMRSL